MLPVARSSRFICGAIAIAPPRATCYTHSLQNSFSIWETLVAHARSVALTGPPSSGVCAERAKKGQAFAVKRWAVLTLLLSGCSTAPLADVLDHLKPGRLEPGQTAPYGGVCNPHPGGPAPTVAGPIPPPVFPTAPAPTAPPTGAPLAPGAAPSLPAPVMPMLLSGPTTGTSAGPNKLPAISTGNPP